MTLVGTHPPLMTVEEVARRVRQSPRTIRRKIADGEIAAVRLGDFGPLRVPADEVDAWLERCRVIPQEAA